jgi:hypothetical protein
MFCIIAILDVCSSRDYNSTGLVKSGALGQNVAGILHPSITESQRLRAFLRQAYNISLRDRESGDRVTA